MKPEEAKKISDQINYWANNPVEFIKSHWPTIKIWPKLAEICNSVRDHWGTVVPSGHGVGKSFTTAKIALWWLFTHYPSKVLTTAPTWAQVESVLWGEIRSSLQTSKIKLCDDRDVLQVELNLAPDWFAKGVSTTETVDQREFGSTKFQGYHSPYLLAILDEAPGVNRAIHIAVETLATGKNNRILKIGNPTSPSGPFFENCNSEAWNKVNISCFDHPNVQEKREVIPGAVTIEWIERVRKEWGEDSPLWKAKVLGHFPDEGEDTLIPLSWCENAVSAEILPNDISVLGVDVARFGDDKTEGYEVVSNIVKHVLETSKEDTMQLAGRLVHTHERYQLIYVDGTGVGGGTVDRAREVLDDTLEPKDKQGHKIVEVHNAAKANQEERFANLRAEMYWHLRERLRPDAEVYMHIRLPNDQELFNELAAMKFTYTSNGRIIIESKEDIKKRIGKSPDKADALCLAVWASRPNKPEKIVENSLYKEFFQFKRQQTSSSNFVNRL